MAGPWLPSSPGGGPAPRSVAQNPAPPEWQREASWTFASLQPHWLPSPEVTNQHRPWAGANSLRGRKGSALRSGACLNT